MNLAGVKLKNVNVSTPVSGPVTYYYDTYQGTGSVNSHSPDIGVVGLSYNQEGTSYSGSINGYLYNSDTSSPSASAFTVYGSDGEGPPPVIANVAYVITWSWYSGTIVTGDTNLGINLLTNSGTLGISVSNNSIFSSHGPSSNPVTLANNTAYSGTYTVTSTTIRVQFAGADFTFANPFSANSAVSQYPQNVSSTLIGNSRLNFIRLVG